MSSADDDSEGVILHRLKDFENYSAPLIDHYKGAAYHRIAADGDRDAITEDLLSLLLGQVSDLPTSVPVGLSAA